MLTLFLAIMVGLPQPLVAVQILWINLVTDGLPALALGTEPKEPDVLRRPPRNPSEGVVTRDTALDILWYGGFMTLAALAAYAHGLYWFCLVPAGQVGVDAVLVALRPSFWLDPGLVPGLEKARTLTFGTLAFSQLVHAFNCRSGRYSLFELGATTNPRLLGAIVVSGLAQLAVLYTPIGNRVFHTVPIAGVDLAAAILLSGSPLLFGEIRKKYRRRTARRPAASPAPSAGRPQGRARV